MTVNEFYVELLSANQLKCDNPNDETKLKELEGYDSLAILTIIAFIDEKFGVKISDEQFDNLVALHELVMFIGIDRFDK